MSNNHVENAFIAFGKLMCGWPLDDKTYRSRGSLHRQFPLHRQSHTPVSNTRFNIRSASKTSETGVSRIIGVECAHALVDHCQRN